MIFLLTNIIADAADKLEMIYGRENDLFEEPDTTDLGFCDVYGQKKRQA